MYLRKFIHGERVWGRGVARDKELQRRRNNLEAEPRGWLLNGEEVQPEKHLGGRIDWLGSGVALEWKMGVWWGRWVESRVTHASWLVQHKLWPSRQPGTETMMQNRAQFKSWLCQLLSIIASCK